MSLNDDNYFMQVALRLAKQALAEEEIPVGAVVVCAGRIVGKGYNQTERLHDATAHAEMIALTAASNHFSSKYLPDCTVYCTVEPCAMCAAALAWAQVDRLVFGASDPKKGFRRYQPNILTPKMKVVAGIQEQACSELMRTFFRLRRQK